MNEFSVTPFSVTQLCDLINSNNSDTQNKLATISRKIRQDTPLSAEEIVKSKAAFLNKLKTPKTLSRTTPNNNFPVRNEIHPRANNGEPMSGTYKGEPIHHSRYATPAIRNRLSPEEPPEEQANRDSAASIRETPSLHVNHRFATPTKRVGPSSNSKHGEHEM